MDNEALRGPRCASVTGPGRFPRRVWFNAETCRLLRRRMGYVIQDGGLFPHLTAAGNVTLMAAELRWEGGRIRKRLAELAEIILRNCPGVQILATDRKSVV